MDGSLFSPAVRALLRALCSLVDAHSSPLCTAPSCMSCVSACCSCAVLSQPGSTPNTCLQAPPGL